MDTLAHWLESLLSGQSPFQIFIAVGVAYLGGVASSFTPCIYPMIPITVSMVGGVSVQKNRWRAVVIRTLVYIGGMALVYSFLGVIAGASGKIFGAATNTSGWYIALGVIITGAALWMMDVIEFDPQVWVSRLIAFVRRSPKPPQHPTLAETTLGAAFVLGVSSGFIAAPCTTPVLAAILAYVAKTQSVELGFFLMVAFSLGLGTLLMVIALFTNAIESLPRSGAWMKKVKHLSGIILLVFAQYLIYRAGQTASH